MKKTVQIASTFLCLILFMTSCAFNFNKDTITAPKPHTFGATYMTMNNPYFDVLNEHIKSQIETNGDILITRDPALSIEKQIDQVYELIDLKVEAIFLNPVDWKGIKPALEAAKQAGIPVINLDATVYDEDLVASIIQSDNYDAGVQCANDMMKRIKSGNIAILEHPSAKSATDRTQSFMDTIKDQKGYHVVERESSEGQLEQAMPAAEKILKRRTDIDVFMSLNDPTALGVFAALQIYHPDKEVLIYGVDGSPEAKKLIKDGLMTATAAQSLKEMGVTAAQTAYDILDGKEVQKNIFIGVTLITKENIDNFDLNGWQ